MSDQIKIQTDLKIIQKYIRESVQESIKESNSQKQSEKEILNVKESADFLNLAVQTIYTFTSQGKIPHFKKGKRLYFHRSELLEWLTSGRSAHKFR